MARLRRLQHLAESGGNHSERRSPADRSELSYREYERTIEMTEGPVQVQWPKTEVIVLSITRLDRPAKQEKGAAA
jgi:hypothetical protein